MGLFVWDPLSSILNSTGLFIDHSELFINHSRLYNYKSFKTIYRLLGTIKNNSRQLLNHKDQCRKNPARSMMNQRQNMF